MTSMASMPEATPPSPRRRRRFAQRPFVWGALGLLVIYLVLAYFVMPALWQRFEERHPALPEITATITHTGSGIPGDPLNIALVGSERDIHVAMLGASWYPADPITLASSIRIAGEVMLHRAYKNAPVSNLYLFGRKEDLAFEFPVGNDPDKRHHVRFWKSEKVDAQDRPLWYGAATLDAGVGVSHDTGQITHHISPNLDAERDLIIGDLRKLNFLSRVYWIDDFHKVLEGRNGGGDPWRTDGKLAVGVITTGRTTTAPATKRNN